MIHSNHQESSLSPIPYVSLPSTSKIILDDERNKLLSSFNDIFGIAPGEVRRAQDDIWLRYLVFSRSGPAVVGLHREDDLPCGF